MAKKVFAVIPARNEEKHIYKVAAKVKKYVDKVIVVDDGSTDKTGEMAKKANAIVLRHLVNLENRLRLCCKKQGGCYNSDRR